MQKSTFFEKEIDDFHCQYFDHNTDDMNVQYMQWIQMFSEFGETWKEAEIKRWEDKTERIETEVTREKS